MQRGADGYEQQNWLDRLAVLEMKKSATSVQRRGNANAAMQKGRQMQTNIAMNDVDRAALRALGYRLGDDCGYQWQTTLLVLRREGAVFETARTELGRPLRLAHWGDRAYVLVGAVAYRISPLPAMGSYWYAAAVRAAA